MPRVPWRGAAVCGPVLPAAWCTVIRRSYLLVLFSLFGSHAKAALKRYTFTNVRGSCRKETIGGRTQKLNDNHWAMYLFLPTM